MLGTQSVIHCLVRLLKFAPVGGETITDATRLVWATRAGRDGE